MYCDRRGNGQKPTRTKHTGQKPPRTIEIEFVQGLLSGIFVLDLLKIGGSDMCDVLSRGVPGCVTKCDRGRGSKLVKNNVTYFMDGPLAPIEAGQPLGFSSSKVLHALRFPEVTNVTYLGGSEMCDK